MLINDILSKIMGVRLVREKYLEDILKRNESSKLNDKAAKCLHVMTTVNGKSLSPALRKQSDEYAREVLGDLEYAPWLYVYCAMQGKFREGWMPENYFHLIVVPKIMKGLSDLTTLKTFSNLLLRTDALPDIAYSIDGVCYDRDYRIISRAEMAAIAKSHGDVYVKGDGGEAGNNIKRLSGEALQDHVFSDDGVVQSAIRPHPFFDEFVTGAVATLRITTVKTPSGKVALRGARLRFGRSDSSWLTSSRSVRVAILDREGTLDEFGYTPEWRAWSAHPDTGVPFAGRKVPSFARAADLCLELHANLPHFAVIGWDVAVNREGKPELIEWNGGHCAISFQEGLDGPHFSDMGWERFAKRH